MWRKRLVEKLGKRLAYVLRHRPDTLGLTLDEGGWTDLATLVARLEVPLEDVLQVVATDSKARYSIHAGRIRANQGHSVPGIEAFTPADPPALLYHGTTRERWPQIQASGGLLPMARHHVHLSADEATARQVGSRRRSETLLVLRVEAAAMRRDGHPFWISENGVWLAERVPCTYLRLPAGSFDP